MKSRSTRPRSFGFTLVELMIAMALTAILVTIALPAYRGYVERARVVAAVSDIAAMQPILERYFTDHSGYPQTLADAGLALVDPWGNPYRYQRMSDATPGQVRKDRSLHPLSSDYDLYSMGADGQSSTPLTAARSRDDVIRAGNGAFIGLASNY